jgi:2-dehydropantoate 2-reductase
MKTQDTTAAVRELGSEAPSSITVVCAQNGVENERIALRLFADVQAMCVMLPATHLEPGLVVVNSAPISGILDIGSYPLGTNAATDAIAADLRAADFSCVAHPKVMRAKYAKLVMNLTNALEAACGTFARDSKVAVAAREEATACFEAAGIEHASEEEDRERRGSTLELRRVSGHRRQGGSTWQSLARGTGSIEVDYLNGEVVLLGRLHGVATPVNAALQSIANDLAAAGAPPGSMTIEQVEELAFAD